MITDIYECLPALSRTLDRVLTEWQIDLQISAMDPL